MPRAISDDTLLILWWLWRLPWASAADVARITGLSANGVSNVLSRNRAKGRIVSARLGRTSDAVDRFVFSIAGVEEFHRLYEWPIFWWHTADGVRSLAKRIEVVEMAYRYLPVLWRSNLVMKPSCYVYRERQDNAWQTGEPVIRVELEEADWTGGEMFGFQWLDRGPFEAIVTYDDGGLTKDLLIIPVIWRGIFQKPSDIASVKRDMQRDLVQDPRWGRLPHLQALSPEYCPGLIVLCSDRVSAAMAQRNWLESLTGQTATRPAIIDTQGQVIRAMSPPTAWWSGFQPPRQGGDLKDVSKAVRHLASGPYAAVNGVRSWRLFRSVDGSPGVTIDQVAEFVGVSTTVAKNLLEPMTKRKAKDKKRNTELDQVKGRTIFVKQGGHYLDASGRALLANSQRKTPARVLKRLGVFGRRGGEYRRAQRIHNQGQADVIRYLRRNGYAAFPSMGFVIEYWHHGRRIRVVPDAFVVLYPGVLVAIEFERSATSLDELREKAEKYGSLAAIQRPIPVLFVTETMEAARNVAELRFPYVLASTLDAVRDGPHGKTIIIGKGFGQKPGCWWYWRSDRDAPTPDAPIDLGASLYALRYENTSWRLPLDISFESDNIEP